jgi:aldehyde:ferredoxin oxidoreductase
LDGFNSVTSLGYDMQNFMNVGQRSWVLKRALNNIMGVTAEDDRLPKKILTALVDGAAAGSTPDEDLMRREYYEIRGLDEKGIPTPHLLDSSGLEFLNERLEKARRVLTSTSSVAS